MVSRKLTPDQQAKEFAQGLALGILASGVDLIPGDKLGFDSRVRRALRDVPPLLDRYPSIMHPNRSNAYAAVMRSERRQGPIWAAWTRVEGGLQPYVWDEGWTVEESGEALASTSDTEWLDWQRLGRTMIEQQQADGR